MSGRALRSDYMHFAKRGAGARYSLAGSGVADCVVADLGPVGELALRGDNAYGYAPLMERIASRAGAPAACVVTAAGTAFANHLAFASLLSPGDEVLIEDPVYELLTSTLSYLGARIRRFRREPAESWRLDPEAVAALLTPRTRLVVLTNLHNPSGALTPLGHVHALADKAARVGAFVLVDEVYLELLSSGAGVPTAFRPEANIPEANIHGANIPGANIAGANIPGANIIVTSSLTKAYGLSGLRCGWILAPEALAQRMRRLNDLFADTAPFIVEQFSLRAFDRLDALRTRAERILSANRAAYREILGAHPALDQVICDHATTVFPRLRAGDGDAFFRRLMTDFETSVVPGRFFGRPEHIRIGLGEDPATTRVGLERVAEALS